MLRSYNLGAKGSVSFVGPANNPVPNVANMNDIPGFSVINWNQAEIVTWQLYDSAAYPAAGTLGLQFFQVPVGSGTGFGGAAKTLSDTNMQLPGMLPSGQCFIITSFEVDFQPTTPTGANASYLPAAAGLASGAAGIVPAIINDAYIFRRSGNFTFSTLSKNYAQIAPLMRLPATSDFVVDGALSDTTTAAATAARTIAWGTTVGMPYVLTPNNILLPSTTNFQVTLAWPEGLQAIQSAARVFVQLNGLLVRLSQ